METPLSEDDSELEELLSQLEDESLLELKLSSSRLGSGKFVAQGHSGGSVGLSEDLLKRYETLKAQSFGSGGHVDNPAAGIGNTPVQTEAEDLNKKGFQAMSAEEFGRQNVVKPVVAKSSEPRTQQIAVSKEYFHSPSPSPPTRCSCLCISSRKSGKKHKQGHGNRRSDGRGGGRAWIDQVEGEEEDEWARVVKKLEGADVGDHDAEVDMDASLFDLKKTDKEFKKASKKQKQLTEEAQKFVELVASSSARFSLSPDHVSQHSDLNSKHP